MQNSSSDNPYDDSNFISYHESIDSTSSTDKYHKRKMTPMESMFLKYTLNTSEDALSNKYNVTSKNKNKKEYLSFLKYKDANKIQRYHMLLRKNGLGRLFFYNLRKMYNYVYNLYDFIPLYLIQNILIHYYDIYQHVNQYYYHDDKEYPTFFTQQNEDDEYEYTKFSKNFFNTNKWKKMYSKYEDKLNNETYPEPPKKYISNKQRHKENILIYQNLQNDHMNNHYNIANNDIENKNQTNSSYLFNVHHQNCPSLSSNNLVNINSTLINDHHFVQTNNDHMNIIQHMENIQEMSECNLKTDQNNNIFNFPQDKINPDTMKKNEKMEFSVNKKIKTNHNTTGYNKRNNDRYNYSSTPNFFGKDEYDNTSYEDYIKKKKKTSLQQVEENEIII